MNGNNAHYGHNHCELVGGLVIFAVIIVFMAGASHWMNNKDNSVPTFKKDVVTQKVLK